MQKEEGLVSRSWLNNSPIYAKMRSEKSNMRHFCNQITFSFQFKCIIKSKPTIMGFCFILIITLTCILFIFLSMTSWLSLLSCLINIDLFLFISFYLLSSLCWLTMHLYILFCISGGQVRFLTKIYHPNIDKASSYSICFTLFCT